MADELRFKVTADGIDKATKQVDALAKAADEVDGKKLTLTADVKGTRDVDAFVKKLDGLSDTDKVVMLAVRTADAEARIRDLTLEIAALDSSDPTIDVKMNSLQDAIAEVDQLDAKMGELGKNIDPATFDQAKGKLDGMRDSADQSRSVFANMVGNATQDLGNLGGAAGTAGVALGQIGEYAADGSLSLKGMATAAPAMLVLGLAVGVVVKQMEKAAAVKAFNKKQVEDFTDAIQSADGATASLVEQFVKAGAIKQIPLFSDDVADLVPALDKAGVSVQKYVELITKGGPAFTEFKSAQAAAGKDMAATQQIIDAAGAANENFIESQDRAAIEARVFGDSLKETKAAAEDATDAIQTQIDALDEQTATLQGQADALQANIDKQNELTQAMADAADAGLDFQDSFDDFSETVYKVNAAQTDGKTSAADLEKMYRELARSSDKMADASVNVRVEQDKANGVQTSATAKLDTWNQHMLTAAATAQGPARQAVINYMTEVNKIPPDKVTEFTAAVNAGDLQTAQAILDEASKARDVAYNADADAATLSQTDKDLDRVANDRYVKFFAQLGLTSIVGGAVGAVTRATGQTTTLAAPASPAGRTALAASADGEAVLATAPASLVAGPSVAAVPVAGAVNVTQIIQMPRLPTGRELARLGARWARVNGA